MRCPGSTSNDTSGYRRALLTSIMGQNILDSAHSLGVMHLAGRFVEKILRRPYLRAVLKDRQGWSEGEFEAKVDQIELEARLAGLLHDIGHAPLSHTGEITLFPKGKRHEHLQRGDTAVSRVRNWGYY